MTVQARSPAPSPGGSSTCFCLNELTVDDGAKAPPFHIAARDRRAPRVSLGPEPDADFIPLGGLEAMTASPFFLSFFLLCQK
jgi:hypothetical protein